MRGMRVVWHCEGDFHQRCIYHEAVARKSAISCWQYVPGGSAAPSYPGVFMVIWVDEKAI